MCGITGMPSHAFVFSPPLCSPTRIFVSEDAVPERVRRMQTELAGAARGLFDDDRKRFEEFLNALVAATSKDPNFPNKEAREEVVKFVPLGV